MRRTHITTVILLLIISPSLFASTHFMEKGMKMYGEGIYPFSSSLLDSACLYFSKAIDKDKACWKAYFHRAKVYMMQGKLDEAIRDFEKAQFHIPSGEFSLKSSIRSLVYILKGRGRNPLMLSQAIDKVCDRGEGFPYTVEKTALIKPFADNYGEKGKKRLATVLYQQCINSLELTIPMLGESGDQLHLTHCHYMLGCLYRNVGGVMKAEQYFSKAGRGYVKLQMWDRAAISYKNAGECIEKEDRLEEAVESYKTAAECFKRA